MRRREGGSEVGRGEERWGEEELQVDGVQVDASCFMVRSNGVYQEAELVNETEEVFQGARESRASGGKAEDINWESVSGLTALMLR